MPVRLHLLEHPYAVCQLEPSSAIPVWSDGEGFVSISRTDEELSVVCREDRVLSGVKAERGWRCFQFAGPFDFALSGILASVLKPLAEARIGIFVVSTYNTDYLLVKEHDLEKAVEALERAGHSIVVESERSKVEGRNQRS